MTQPINDYAGCFYQACTSELRDFGVIRGMHQRFFTLVLFIRIVVQGVQF